MRYAIYFQMGRKKYVCTCVIYLRLQVLEQKGQNSNQQIHIKDIWVLFLLSTFLHAWNYFQINSFLKSRFKKSLRIPSCFKGFCHVLSPILSFSPVLSFGFPSFTTVGFYLNSLLPSPLDLLLVGIV